MTGFTYMLLQTIQREVLDMKRFYVSLLLLVFSVICIFAADEIKTLEVSAIVPVDYGVVFPDEDGPVNKTT